MPDCCTTPVRDSRSTGCRRCGQAGKRVALVTPKGLLTPQALARLDAKASYRFGRTANCPVVYFAGDRVFDKGDVTARVFQKETTDPLPVCYCFAITREAIDAEKKRAGKSTAAQRVAAHVKAGRCACEIRNPQGSCCPGNLRAVVEQLRDGAPLDAR